MAGVLYNASKWRKVTEKKADEYPVEITYNIELDAKSLQIVRAVYCEVYEWHARSNRDMKKRLARKAIEPIKQITYNIEGSNEVLILPLPGECVVDELDIDRDDTSDEPNRTKDFKLLPAPWKPTYTIVKFNHENPSVIERFEMPISPKFMESEKARVKIRSYSAKVVTEEYLRSSGIKVMNVDEDSRFYFFNGKGSRLFDKYQWGKYEEQDRGYYASFGVVVLPQDIWSKIPKINAFILKIVGENPKQDIFLIEKDEQKWTGVTDVIEELGMLTVGNNYGISDFIVGNDYLAKKIATGTGVLEDKWPFVVRKGREMDYKQILKKSDWRDYYYPLIKNKEEKVWRMEINKKGMFILQKSSNETKAQKGNSDSTEYNAGGTATIIGKTFTNVGQSILYNNKTSELLFPIQGYGIYLK